jgi:hypothetical protein
VPKKLFPRKFYRHGPDCRQRMERLEMGGRDVMSCEIDYKCPCGPPKTGRST